MITHIRKPGHKFATSYNGRISNVLCGALCGGSAKWTTQETACPECWKIYDGKK